MTHFEFDKKKNPYRRLSVEYEFALENIFLDIELPDKNFLKKFSFKNIFYSITNSAICALLAFILTILTFYITKNYFSIFSFFIFLGIAVISLTKLFKKNRYLAYGTIEFSNKIKKAIFYSLLLTQIQKNYESKIKKACIGKDGEIKLLFNKDTQITINIKQDFSKDNTIYTLIKNDYSDALNDDASIQVLHKDEIDKLKILRNFDEIKKIVEHAINHFSNVKIEFHKEEFIFEINVNNFYTTINKSTYKKENEHMKAIDTLLLINEKMDEYQIKID